MDECLNNIVTTELVVVGKAAEEIWRASEVATPLQFTIFLISSTSWNLTF